MINITEISPPKKVSGISSFEISFPYDQRIVDAIKTLPTHSYDKKTYTWEIPVDCIAKALDSLTFIDQINLKCLPDLDALPNQGVFELTADEIASFKYKPFQHQIDGINFGLKHQKWLNLMSMGLGKTVTLIYEAEILKRRGLIDHCFIICGVDSLRQQWKAEIEKFSNESVLVLGEKVSKSGKISYTTLSDRAKQLKEPISEFFVITNIASIRSDDIVEAFIKSKNNFGMICLDECHRVATKSSQQGTNLLKLKSKYKIAMSGSLVTNNPISCYVPLVWTENDRANLTMYKSQYCNYGGFGGKQIIGYKNLDTLREELQGCSIRKKLEDVRNDMPAKTVSVELVEMSDAHAKFYDAIKSGVKEEADKIELKSSNLLALTTRLRQATSDPTILTSQQIISSKLERCAELVEDLVLAGEKVVVMDVFKSSINRLATMLDEFKPLVCTGDVADTQVNNNIQQFRNDPNSKVLLGTSQKIGTGFSLPEAHYLIMLSTPWTYAEFSQNTDRIYRVNSDQPVYIKVLLTKDTIDERVWEIVDKKKQISDYLVDGIENELSNDLRDEMLKIIKSL